MFIIDIDSESYFIDDIMKNCRPLKIGEPERMEVSNVPSAFLLSPTEDKRSISIGMKPVDRLITGTKDFLEQIR